MLYWNILLNIWHHFHQMNIKYGGNSNTCRPLINLKKHKSHNNSKNISGYTENEQRLSLSQDSMSEPGNLHICGFKDQAQNVGLAHYINRHHLIESYLFYNIHSMDGTMKKYIILSLRYFYFQHQGNYNISSCSIFCYTLWKECLNCDYLQFHYKYEQNE